jgi:hypothetical protein
VFHAHWFVARLSLYDPEGSYIFPEILVNFYQTTRGHISEYSALPELLVKMLHILYTTLGKGKQI